MADTRPITADDLLRIKVVSEPQVSPDGSRVAFVVRVTDADKNKYWSHLWLVGATADGEARPAARQFTYGEVGDGAPRWSPDGRQIAFLRTRDRQTQLWTIPADGGEARPLTRLDEGQIGAPAWSPDGTRLAFTFRPTHPDFTQAARKAREEGGKSTPARHITRLHYRLDGYGWLDCRQHVWVCDAITGAATQITAGDEDDGEIAWSPDGTHLVFVSNRSAEPEVTPAAVDLWLVAADQANEPASEFRRLPTPPGYKSGCAWSPDGRWIAYGGIETTDEAPWVAKYTKLWVVPVDGGEARCLTATLDRNLGNHTLGDIHPLAAGGGPIEWADDSSGLWFLAGDRGSTLLYRVGLDGGEPVALTGHGQVLTGFDRAGETIAAVITSPTQPGDVYRLSPSTGEPPTRLTDLHADLLAEVHVAEPEEVWFDSADGTRVQGWLLRPPDFDAGRQYPGILSIHGGPHSQYGNVFFHELQWLAALGYVVLYPNPRGSTNVGEDDMACIRGAWGEKDYADLMAAADFAAGLPYVDEARMAVCGGSYGGYSTNWLVGHTDRFTCAITDRSVVSLVTQNGQSDIPMRPEGYFPGNTWDAPGVMLEHSPLTYLANCTTPLLIIHSEGDWRCPIGQAQELYHALKRLRRCHVEFVWYPPEANHGLSRGGPPDLRLDRLTRYAAWFERYLR